MVEKVLSSDGSVVEEAEAASQVTLGVVAWRSAQRVHQLVFLCNINEHSTPRHTHSARVGYLDRGEASWRGKVRTVGYHVSASKGHFHGLVGCLVRDQGKHNERTNAARVCSG
jgi:hypothetical protein